MPVPRGKSFDLHNTTSELSINHSKKPIFIARFLNQGRDTYDIKQVFTLVFI